jgi:hypothetical protein
MHLRAFAEAVSGRSLSWGYFEQFLLCRYSSQHTEPISLLRKRFSVLWRHHVIRCRFLVRRRYLPILLGGKSHPPTMIRKLANFQNINIVWLMR